MSSPLGLQHCGCPPHVAGSDVVLRTVVFQRVQNVKDSSLAQ